VEQVGLRKKLTPELVILLAALLVGFGLVMRTSSGECHHWKQELSHITGAFLAGAGEEEHPESGGARGQSQEESESLRRATNRVLDARPFGCF
jgi:hypothetical protein